MKRARSVVDAPRDALSNFLLSQIRAAFGDRATPLTLAEKAVALDGRTAKYHRQIAEVLGVTAQHAGTIQQLFLARRFRKRLTRPCSFIPGIFSPCATCWSSTCLLQALPVGIRTKRSKSLDGSPGSMPSKGFWPGRASPGFKRGLLPGETMLRQAADTEPPRDKAHIALAQFYLEAGHSNRARPNRQARAAMNLDPGRVDAYALLAAIYADRGAWRLTGCHVGRFPSRGAGRRDPAPDHRAAERLLAAWTRPTGPSVICGCTWRRKPEGNQPSASEARWRLGLALEAKGSAADAMAEFKESVRLDPESKAAQEIKTPGRCPSSGRVQFREVHVNPKITLI